MRTEHYLPNTVISSKYSGGGCENQTENYCGTPTVFARLEYDLYKLLQFISSHGTSTEMRFIILINCYLQTNYMF